MSSNRFTFPPGAARACLGPVMGLVIAAVSAGITQANPIVWQGEWPKTDFAKHTVPLNEVKSVIRKDQIPAIDNPRFQPVKEIKDLPLTEPVISIKINGDSRAYPIRILTWHEIVNDTVGDVPVSVTYCPLCNSSIVFDRRVGKDVLDFGTTGKLRNSDLVMYDRQTESWWQQFLGVGIVGKYSGTKLTMVPARVESFAAYRTREPDGKVLIPRISLMRPYGRNPYVGYDRRSGPFSWAYNGSMPEGIAPMAYVVAVGDQAWSLKLLREKKKIEAGDLILTWTPGQNSALDDGTISDGRDLGNVVVQQKTGTGLKDAVHDLTFAFSFHAFKPKGVIHK